MPLSKATRARLLYAGSAAVVALTSILVWRAQLPPPVVPTEHAKTPETTRPDAFVEIAVASPLDEQGLTAVGRPPQVGITARHVRAGRSRRSRPLPRRRGHHDPRRALALRRGHVGRTLHLAARKRRRAHRPAAHPRRAHAFFRVEVRARPSRSRSGRSAALGCARGVRAGRRPGRAGLRFPRRSGATTRGNGRGREGPVAPGRAAFPPSPTTRSAWSSIPTKAPPSTVACSRSACVVSARPTSSSPAYPCKMQGPQARALTGLCRLAAARTLTSETTLPAADWFAEPGRQGAPFALHFAPGAMASGNPENDFWDVGLDADTRARVLREFSLVDGPDAGLHPETDAEFEARVRQVRAGLPALVARWKKDHGTLQVLVDFPAAGDGIESMWVTVTELDAKGGARHPGQRAGARARAASRQLGDRAGSRDQRGSAGPPVRRASRAALIFQARAAWHTLRPMSRLRVLPVLAISTAIVAAACAPTPAPGIVLVAVSSNLVPGQDWQQGFLAVGDLSPGSTGTSNTQFYPRDTNLPFTLSFHGIEPDKDAKYTARARIVLAKADPLKAGTKSIDDGAGTVVAVRDIQFDLPGPQEQQMVRISIDWLSMSESDPKPIVQLQGRTELRPVPVHLRRPVLDHAGRCGRLRPAPGRHRGPVRSQDRDVRPEARLRRRRVARRRQLVLPRHRLFRRHHRGHGRPRQRRVPGRHRRTPGRHHERRGAHRVDRRRRDRALWHAWLR